LGVSQYISRNLDFYEILMYTLMSIGNIDTDDYDVIYINFDMDRLVIEISSSDNDPYELLSLYYWQIKRALDDYEAKESKLHRDIDRFKELTERYGYNAEAFC
jgi:hypothetical protein